MSFDPSSSSLPPLRRSARQRGRSCRELRSGATPVPDNTYAQGLPVSDGLLKMEKLVVKIQVAGE
eukprot:3360512-Rhodomonas_salina.2